jgi:hypothetical protein
VSEEAGLLESDTRSAVLARSGQRQLTCNSSADDIVVMNFISLKAFEPPPERAAVWAIFGSMQCNENDKDNANDQ